MWDWLIKTGSDSDKGKPRILESLAKLSNILG